MGFHSEMPCPSLIALVTSCSTDSPRFHSHLVGLLSRPGAHWGSQYQVGAAIFLSASKAREKTRSHREHDIAFNVLLGYNFILDMCAIQRLEMSRRYGSRTHVIKRVVSVTCYPQPVEKNSKFSSHRDDRSFLAIFPAPWESRMFRKEITAILQTSERLEPHSSGVFCS